jgi:hypothetical protein
MNIPVMEITFAPRWNFLLAEGTAPDGCMIQVAIAGIGDVTIDNATTTPPAAAASAEMTFTMPVAKGRSNAKRKPSNDVLPLSFESDIPF